MNINRKISIQKALDATNRKQYIDQEVLKSALKVKGDELEFFKLEKYISDDDLEKEYEKRNLIPADIYTLCAYDVENPTKMHDMKRVCTHWKDVNGKWCYAAFSRWDVDRNVRVFRDDYGWLGRWWFAGLRKFGTRSSDSQNSLNLSTLSLDSAIAMVKEAGYKIIKEI